MFDLCSIFFYSSFFFSIAIDGISKEALYALFFLDIQFLNKWTVGRKTLESYIL